MKSNRVSSAAALVVVMIAATVAIRRHHGETVTGQSSTTPQAGITHAPFGTTPDGQAVTVFTLTNTHHMEVRVMTYGGTILSIKVPDRDDKIADVVLGYDSLADYVKASPYFGAIVGRYGNRIAKAHFALDGKDYLLAANNGPNALHGGLKGFDKVVWQPKILQNDQATGLVLTHTSPDGDQGYPGTLTAQVTYILYRMLAGSPVSRDRRQGPQGQPDRSPPASSPGLARATFSATSSRSTPTG